jgi:hypothetical protein
LRRLGEQAKTFSEPPTLYDTKDIKKNRLKAIEIGVYCVDIKKNEGS